MPTNLCVLWGLACHNSCSARNAGNGRLQTKGWGRGVPWAYLLLSFCRASAVIRRARSVALTSQALLQHRGWSPPFCDGGSGLYYAAGLASSKRRRSRWRWRGRERDLGDTVLAAGRPLTPRPPFLVPPRDGTFLGKHARDLGPRRHRARADQYAPSAFFGRGPPPARPISFRGGAGAAKGLSRRTQTGPTGRRGSDSNRGLALRAPDRRPA